MGIPVAFWPYTVPRCAQGAAQQQHVLLVLHIYKAEMQCLIGTVKQRVLHRLRACWYWCCCACSNPRSLSACKHSTLQSDCCPSVRTVLADSNGTAIQALISFDQLPSCRSLSRAKNLLHGRTHLGGGPGDCHAGSFQRIYFVGSSAFAA